MKRFLLLLAFVPVLAIAGTSPWAKVTQSTTCQAVDDDPAVTILDADNTRLRWSVWTTSGAPTIYFREDGTATATSATSGPLVGGQSYTEDSIAVTKAVTAITLSGTAWVCVKEAVAP